MNALIYDTETTGLDPAKDRIVQHGALIYNLRAKKVVDTRSWLAFDKSFPSVADGEKVHGWNLSTLMQFGHTPEWCMMKLREFATNYGVELVIAHNGINFDRNMYSAEEARCAMAMPLQMHLDALPWLDTLAHVTFPRCPGKSLLTINAFHGFINPFPHDAISDCLSIVKILDLNPTLVLEMVRTAAADNLLVVANIPPDFNEARNAKLKTYGFTWKEHKGHFVDKSWIKVLPKKEFDEFRAGCEFQVNVLKDIPAADCYRNLKARLDEFYDKLWHG